jgi:hypothetical protein
MAIDFSLLVYDACETVFGRPITVNAVVSRAGAVYNARGILDTRGTVVQTEFGQAVLSDQETILDIRERDLGFEDGVPKQGDIIDVPPDGEIIDMVGTYVVTDAAWNGGGEVTLVLQKQVTPEPDVPMVNPYDEP